MNITFRKAVEYIARLRLHYFYSELSELRKSDVVFLCHDDDRSIILDGKFYSPLLDPIRERMTERGIKCQSICLPWSRYGARMTSGKAALFNREYLIQKWSHKFFGSKIFSAYKKIFRRTGAKCIIGIGIQPDLCRFAHQNGIVAIEVLHGMGYTFLPWNWSNLHKSDLPSKVVALDQVSYETFSKLKSKGISVDLIKHPFYEKIFNKNFASPAEWSYAPKNHKKNVIVTLQWGYDGAEPEFNKILKNGVFYEELEAIIDKRPDIFWHFRLHPVQLKGDASNAALSYVRRISNEFSNTSWKRASEVPFFNVASVCDAHITMSSMSCYDAAMVGVPSLALCPTLRGDGRYNEYFLDLVNCGYVSKMPFDITSVERWINNAERLNPKFQEESKFTWDKIICKIKGNEV